MPFGVRMFPALPEVSDEELAEVGAILPMRRGFSLGVYKDACMKRLSADIMSDDYRRRAL